MQQTGRQCGLCSITGASEPSLKWQTVHQHYSLSSLKSVSEHKCHRCGSLLMPLLGCCTLLGNFDWPISPVVALLLPGYSKSHASVSCTSAPGSQEAASRLCCTHGRRDLRAGFGAEVDPGIELEGGSGEINYGEGGRRPCLRPVDMAAWQICPRRAIISRMMDCVCPPF